MNENHTQRDAVMAALAVAEEITSTAPQVPYDIEVRPGSLDVHFYRQPGDVAEFAVAFGLELSLREQLTGNGKPIIEARGSMRGVSVRGWSLGSVDEVDQYRAVLAGALVELPVEWRAAVAA